jgi:hypothetical protein
MYEKVKRTAEENAGINSDLHRWQEVFEQCLLSCSSPIPLKIRQSFKVLEKLNFSYISLLNAGGY